jgi:hypothetical protein
VIQQSSRDGRTEGRGVCGSGRQRRLNKKRYLVELTTVDSWWTRRGKWGAWKKGAAKTDFSKIDNEI